MNATAIFNLEDIFINELIGDVWLSIFVGVLLILVIGAKSRLPYQLVLLLEVVFIAIMFVVTELEFIWVIVVLIVGAICYYLISRAINR